MLHAVLVRLHLPRAPRRAAGPRTKIRCAALVHRHLRAAAPAERRCAPARAVAVAVATPRAPPLLGATRRRALATPRDAAAGTLRGATEPWMRCGAPPTPAQAGRRGETRQPEAGTGREARPSGEVLPRRGARLRERKQRATATHRRGAAQGAQRGRGCLALHWLSELALGRASPPPPGALGRPVCATARAARSPAVVSQAVETRVGQAGRQAGGRQWAWQRAVTARAAAGGWTATGDRSAYSR